MSEIIIYTDGSCLGNPGPGGWAFLVIEKEKIIKKSSGKTFHTTNNRMEMTAISEALFFIQKKFPTKKISLFSDSNLLIQTLNLGWKRKANLDIWQQIDAGRLNLKISFTWVKAHHTNQYNNLCDELAQKAAHKAKLELAKDPSLVSQFTPTASNQQTQIF